MQHDQGNSNCEFFTGSNSDSNRHDKSSHPSSKMHLGKFPDHTEFQSWIVNFRTEVCSKAKNPTRALQWVKEIEAAKSLDDLITPRSITAQGVPDYEGFRFSFRFVNGANKLEGSPSSHGTGYREPQGKAARWTCPQRNKADKRHCSIHTTSQFWLHHKRRRRCKK